MTRRRLRQLRARRCSGDLGADRAGIFRRLSRPSGRRSAFDRSAGSPKRLHRRSLSGSRGPGRRRGCDSAYRRGAQSCGTERLHVMAAEAGLDVLVEIHDLAELPFALEVGASIIGVNNRNLRTLSVDPDVSRKAVELIPDGTIAVAESGLKNRGGSEGVENCRLRRLSHRRAVHVDR